MHSGNELDNVASGYRIVREIGRGGMGVVYEAWDNQLDRRVAVKMLHPYLFADHVVGEKLLREARLAARIEHPNVIRVYGVEMVDGRLAIEMQFIEGGSLPGVLSAGALPGSQAADLLGQILEALGACHEHSIIHCDLKPGNLLVSLDGRVYLSDFGIAKALSALDGTELGTPMTSGPLWGTPQYTPPEAWHGTTPSPQWDIYAAGVIVYEALLGQLPFEGRTPMAVMLEKHAKPLPSIARARTDISPEFCALVDDLVSHDVERRPKSAKAALLRLQRLPEFLQRDSDTQPLRLPPGMERRAEPAQVPAVPTGPRPAPAVARASRPWWIVGAAVFLLGLAVAAGTLLWKSSAGTGAAALPPYNGEILDLTATNNRIFFSHDDGIHGRELWCVNADGAPWMVADINPGPDGSNPRRFIKRPDDNFFFAATTEEHGEELWHCNSYSPEAKVRMVRDILPGPMGSEPQPVGFHEVVTLFYATTIKEGRELWATNGLAGQTAIVEDINTGTGWSQPMDPAVTNCGNHAYIRAFNGGGQFLWRYEYDTNTIEKIDKCDGSWYIEFAGRLYYDFPTDEHGRELWVYDHEKRETSLFKDIMPGGGSSYPSDFFVHGGKFYFQASTDIGGPELWISDGTVEGTILKREFINGASGGRPTGFVDTGESFLFKAHTESYGQELYWAAGGAIEMVADLRPGTASSGPYNMNARNGWFYFSADDGASGEELWRLDLSNLSTKPELVADLLPGPKGAEPHLMRWVNDTDAYFVGTDATGEQHLYHLKAGADTRVEPLRLIRPQKEKRK
jgi:ELWxxDGT repeat protein